MEERDNAAEVDQECLDRVVAAVKVGTWAGPVACAAVVPLVIDGAPAMWLWTWCASVLLAGVATFITCLRYQRARRAGPVHRWIPAQVTSAWYGMSVGALCFIALPTVGHPEARALAAIVCCGAMASEIVEKAASRAWFLSFNLPLMTTATIGLAVSGAETVFVLMVVAFFAYCLYANRQAGRTLREEIATKLTNAHLAEECGGLARRDPLTDLANRRAVIEALDLGLTRVHRSDGRIGLIFFDLDRFKAVNDAYGHSIGDDLLRSVAARLLELAPAGNLVGRFGGDEFVIVVDPMLGIDHIALLANHIRRRISEPFDLGGTMVQVTPSIGVAVTSADVTSSDELVRIADAALYRAKHGGRNRVELFDESLRASLHQRRIDQRELRVALARGQIVAWYQPTIDLRTGRINGAEALARWIHPTRGVLPAGVFIDIAEEAGLVDRVGDAVARDAVIARVHLATLGVADSFRIRINVSPRQLSNPDQFARLQRLANGQGCSLRWLAAEVTESAVLLDEEGAIAQINEARSLGLTVELDDFGTGYSSLSMLRRLPIDGVKIDRSFVRDMIDDPADAAIVGSVIDLARRLGLTVTAEGVEHQAQMAALEAMGCELAQGYLWSPAVPLVQLCEQLQMPLEQPARADAALAM